MKTTDPSASERLLGRKFRPWWGISPYRLAIRAVVQGAIYGFALYGAAAVASGRFDPGAIGLADHGATVKKYAVFFAVLAVIGLLYSVVRVAVAVMDVLSIKTITGTVVSTLERHRGDFLPAVVQHLIRYWRNHRSGDAMNDLHRSHTQLVLQTADGVRTWTVGNQYAGRLQNGKTVRLRVGRLLGHVSKVDDQMLKASDHSPNGIRKA